MTLLCGAKQVQAGVKKFAKPSFSKNLVYPAYAEF